MTFTSLDELTVLCDNLNTPDYFEDVQFHQTINIHHPCQCILTKRELFTFYKAYLSPYRKSIARNVPNITNRSLYIATLYMLNTRHQISRSGVTRNEDVFTTKFGIVKRVV